MLAVDADDTVYTICSVVDLSNGVKMVQGYYLAGFALNPKQRDPPRWNPLIFKWIFLLV